MQITSYQNLFFMDLVPHRSQEWYSILLDAHVLSCIGTMNAEMCDLVCVWISAKCFWSVSDLENNLWIRGVLSEAVGCETKRQALCPCTDPSGTTGHVTPLCVCVYVRCVCVCLCLCIYVHATNDVTGDSFSEVPLIPQQTTVNTYNTAHNTAHSQNKKNVHANTHKL